MENQLDAPGNEIEVSSADVAPRTARGERRRALILDAAAGVFAERGYHPASIVDIANRAEIAKSVIYDHFASKADLHKALLEAEMEALIGHVATSVPAPEAASHEERLRAGINAFFGYVEERPATWRLLVRDAPTDPELLEVHARIQRQATRAVLLLIAPHPVTDGVKRQHKEMLAELLKTAITGLASWWYDHPDVPRETLVETVMEFAWKGLQRHMSGA
jgi:AcrR family transcriptional regulator